MTVTLITGANKGIGFATAQQLVEQGHTVYVGARDPERGEKAAATLGARFVQLDVTDDASVKAALARIAADEGRLDVLVHNAGILAFDVADGPTALRMFDTNAVGLVRVTSAALPLLRRSENASVVTVSSSMGSFARATDPDRLEYGLTAAALYGATKAAATMLTIQYAKTEPGIRFNALEPGFTATDMTASMGGGRSAADSARTVVRLATLGKDGPTGTYTDEDGPIPW